MFSNLRTSTVDGKYELKAPEASVEVKVKKRRHQNRVAQKKFRERKVAHVIQLEIQVKELETLLANANTEKAIVTSQMSMMEEELCYYRNNVNSVPPLTLASSETSMKLPGAWAQQTGNMSVNNGGNSAHPSPMFIQGDFGPRESMEGYGLPTTPAYRVFKYADTAASLGQGQQ